MRFASKAVRSPLRYPGGKGRAVKHLVPMIEKMGITEMVSPFTGGGNIEIACANRGIQVHGYDLFRPVVVFWQSLLKRKDRLVELVASYHPLEEKTVLKALQEEV